MMWEIQFSKKADKAIAAMPVKARTRVTDAIEALAVDPFKAQHVKPMTGADSRRLRVGDYRVIFRLENDLLIVVIIDIGPRGGIYK